MPKYVLDEEGFVQNADASNLKFPEGQTQPTIHVHGSPKEAPEPQRRNRARRCRYCGVLIPHREFATHMLRNHVQLTPDPSRVACPICGSRIKKGNLENHLSRCHDASREAPAEKDAPQKPVLSTREPTPGTPNS